MYCFVFLFRDIGYYFNYLFICECRHFHWPVWNRNLSSSFKILVAHQNRLLKLEEKSLGDSYSVV